MHSIASIITSSKKPNEEHQCPHESEHIGFAHLSEQIHRKLTKREYQFTVMVVGERGLGKKTLIQSLFRVPRLNSELKCSSDNVEINASSVEIEELGVRVRLTVLTTGGYGDSLNDARSQQTLIDYIDQQFQRYFNDEYGTNRQTIIDHRVHCLLYLISSSHRSLKPLDIQCMKALENRVNLIPIIAKADGLTLNERFKLKQTILEQIAKYRIQIYEIPDCEPEEKEEIQQINRQLKHALPLSIISSNEFVEIDGKYVRARIYPWATINTEHVAHSDMNKLRTILITHMHNLQQMTHEVFYEQYRLNRLRLKQPNYLS